MILQDQCNDISFDEIRFVTYKAHVDRWLEPFLEKFRFESTSDTFEVDSSKPVRL